MGWIACIGWEDGAEVMPAKLVYVPTSKSNIDFTSRPISKIKKNQHQIPSA